MLALAGSLGSAAILVLAVTVLLSRSPEAAASLYAWAAVPQAAVATALAVHLHSLEPALDAAAILAVKGIWAPSLLRRTTRHRGAVYGQLGLLSPPALLVGMAAVTLLCLRVGVMLQPAAGAWPGLALAAVFAGFGAAVVRRELWCQAAGLLTGEAALTLALFALTSGLPAGGETAGLAETVVLAAVLGAAARLVDRTHGALDSRLLRGLRG